MCWGAGGVDCNLSSVPHGVYWSWVKCIFLCIAHFLSCLNVWWLCIVSAGTGQTESFGLKGAVQPVDLMASWQTAACHQTNICSLSLSATMLAYHCSNSLYKHLWHDPGFDHSSENQRFLASMLNGSWTLNATWPLAYMRSYQMYTL